MNRTSYSRIKAGADNSHQGHALLRTKMSSVFGRFLALRHDDGCGRVRLPGSENSGRATVVLRLSKEIGKSSPEVLNAETLTRMSRDNVPPERHPGNALGNVLGNASELRKLPAHFTV